MKKNNLFYFLTLSAMVYFLQGIENIPGMSFGFWLKNLGWSASRIMYMTSLIGLAWLVKPIISTFIDNFFTKKTWILFSIISSILLAVILSIFNISSIYLIMFLMFLASSNAAIRDIANDGMMCIEGKENNATGKIQALQWISITIAGILVGVGGGYIADHFTYKIGYLCLIPFYILSLIILSKYKPLTVIKTKVTWKEIIEPYRTILTDKKFLLISLFLFLYKFSPSFNTALYFIEIDKFKWSQTWIGTLSAIGGAISLIGAVIYYKYSKQINIKKWLIISTFIGALIPLCYMFFTPVTDIIYTLGFSIISLFIFLICMDFMAKNSLNGYEATSFAFLCAISNLASFASNWTGAFLLEKVGLNWLMLLSSITSLFCLPLIPMIFNKSVDKINE